MTNQDTDSNPKVDQWSNGVDQADELLRLMKVRRAALNRIGEHTIRAGAPLATIEEPLVPIFMYHRYAVESTASVVPARTTSTACAATSGRRPKASASTTSARRSTRSR